MNHEPRDLSLRAILIWTASFVFVIVTAAFAIRAVYSNGLPKERKPDQFPLPRLEGEPRQDLQKLRAHENEVLTTEAPGRKTIEATMKEMSQ